MNLEGGVDVNNDNPFKSDTKINSKGINDTPSRRPTHTPYVTPSRQISVTPAASVRSESSRAERLKRKAEAAKAYRQAKRLALDINSKGITVLIDLLAISIRNAASSVAIAPNRKPGANNVKATLRDCRNIPGVSIDCFLKFSKVITRPFFTVTWNSNKDSIETKMKLLEK